MKAACRLDSAGELGLSIKDFRGRRVFVAGTAAEGRHSCMGHRAGQPWNTSVDRDGILSSDKEQAAGVAKQP
jgi:hypothetical protein